MEKDTASTTTANLHTHRQPPPFLNPVFLILLLPTLALIVIFLLVFSFISHTSNIKIKVPDYLNLLLLLLALFCGVFRKRNDGAVPIVKSKSQLHSRWYNYHDPTVDQSGFHETGGTRLRKNSSYPDMRQMTEWETGYNKLRYYDDFELDKYRSSTNEYSRRPMRRSEALDREDEDIKVIPVDTFEVVKVIRRKKSIEYDQALCDEKRASRSNSKRKCKRRQKVRNIHEETEKVPPHAQLFTPPPPPPPPSPPLYFHGLFRKGNKTKRVHSLSPSSPPSSPRSIFNDIFKTGSKSKRFQRLSSSTPPCPPPPPPPPSSIFNNIFKTGSKSKRFQNQSTSTRLASHPSSIFTDIFKTGSKSKRFLNLSRSEPPPPPPLPPSPSSIFNNLFKSASRSKRFINQPRPEPPPPPPLPPSSLFNNIFESGSKSKRHQATFTSSSPPPPPLSPSISNDIFKATSTPPPPNQGSSSRPPLPPKTIELQGGGDDIQNGGVKSPLVQIHTPSPPSPPPFRMAETSFKRSEDFDQLSSNEAFNKMDGGHRSKSLVTCPSPDVNLKADSFIARLKGEWRLEKMNSLRENNDIQAREQD